MYEVFINNLPFRIIEGSIPEKRNRNGIDLICDNDLLFDLIFFQAIEAAAFYPETNVYCNDAEYYWQRLVSKCKLIEAAGGLVQNDANELLLIFRNGTWDLPKGKIDEGESPEKAGIREVEEECGITGLIITGKAQITWHTYPHKDSIALKKTYWFPMKCSDRRNLIPQTEEGITECIWANEEKINDAKKNTFLSIARLLS
jgi:ADP-ribose pyrophosphatase YjhB (NUDIX family)